MYRDTLTVHRYGQFSANNDFHAAELLFVNFHLRHRHRLHDKQGECETYLKL